MIRYTKTKEELAEIGIDVVEKHESDKPAVKKLSRAEMAAGKFDSKTLRQGLIDKTIELVD